MSSSSKARIEAKVYVRGGGGCQHYKEEGRVAKVIAPLKPDLVLSGGISPRVAPFADVRDLGALLQRTGFASPVADVERTVVRYRDFSRLVEDLRGLGETNALAGRSRKFLRRDVLTAALEHYRNEFAENGRLTATFDIVYLTSRAPQDSMR